MNVDLIRKYCMDFPGATENLQWGDDLCFKIRGKIFATLALTVVPQKLCFKCTPETFAELIEREGIGPAPYVGRYHWVITDGLAVLPQAELKEMIRRSYEMVAANAPAVAKNRTLSGRKPARQRAASAVSLRRRAKRGKGDS